MEIRERALNAPSVRKVDEALSTPVGDHFNQNAPRPQFFSVSLELVFNSTRYSPATGGLDGYRGARWLS